MKFLHITDLHFLKSYKKSDSGFEKILYRMKNPLTQLEVALKRINLKNIDFVILTGDLTENGDENDYKTLFDFINSKLNNIPLFIVPGNHDNKKILNSDKYEEFNNIIIISLDSTVNNLSYGDISEDQCVWLENIFKTTNKKIILLLHHHLISSQTDMQQTNYSDNFRKIIKENDNIIGIFNGHVHKGFENSFEGKPYFTGHNLSFMGHPLSDGSVDFYEDAGIYLCEIKDNNEIIRTFIPACEEKNFLGNVKF